MEESRTPTDIKIRDAAKMLAAHRQRPCAMILSSTITRDLVAAFRSTLPPDTKDLDLILYSDGGDINAAYLVARELRRRASCLTVYVPLQAKSAATLIALVGDDLVLGPFGELGALDSQSGEHRRGGLHLDPSSLMPFKAIEQMRIAALDLYDEAVERSIKRDGMTAFDACASAANVVGALFQPVLAKVDPVRVGEGARRLELAAQYACRLFRRYRPELHDDACKAMHRLIHEYASHGFVIDLEELQDLGLPARGCTAEELPIIDMLAEALQDRDDETDTVGFVLAGTSEVCKGL